MKIKKNQLKQDMIGVPHCYFSPNIPKKKLDNAMAIHAIEATENVLLLKDISIVGSGKNGWVLTDKNIYFNHIKNTFCIKYSEIKSISQKGGSIIINDLPRAFVGTKSDAKKLSVGIRNIIFVNKDHNPDTTLALSKPKHNNKTISDSIKRLKQ
jgi:hypothetical protein